MMVIKTIARDEHGRPVSVTERTLSLAEELVEVAWPKILATLREAATLGDEKPTVTTLTIGPIWAGVDAADVARLFVDRYHADAAAPRFAGGFTLQVVPATTAEVAHR
jgi:hypothetical protein